MTAYFYNPLLVILPGGPTLPITGNNGDRFYLTVGDVGVWVCGGANVFTKILDTVSVDIFIPTPWGDITGTLSNQTDLQAVLDTKGTSNFSGVYTDLSGKPTLGTVAATSIGDYATAAQGVTANSAVQPARTVNGHALSADVTVTKADVSLGNADNTSDANKPVSSSQQTALNLKATLASPTFTGTVAGVTKAMVGLSSVDDTSDASKPVSTAQQTALDAKQSTSQKGAANGYAGLDAGGLVPVVNLPGLSAAWGAITGTLSAQTDLQSELDAKQVSGTYATGTGTASGTNTGDQTTVSGNAGTATIFQTARNINGVSFNGSADITVAASGATLTGTTLAAGLIGTSATTACAGNDARLSDARTPTAHSTSHKSGGGDSIALDTLAVPTDITTLNASTSAHGLMPKGSGLTTTFYRSDMTQATPTASVAAPFVGLQSTGSFTVATDSFGLQGKRLTLTTTQRGTLEGTGRLVLVG